MELDKVQMESLRKHLNAIAMEQGDTCAIHIPTSSGMLRVGINPFSEAETEDQDMSPKFTKKHYDQVAEVLRNSISTVSKSESFNENEKQMVLFGVSAVTSALMQQFKEDNPRFDKQLFLTALKEDKQ